jgi:hypothetical protein
VKKIILAVCLLLASLSIHASLLPYVTLAWDANSEPELKGYSVYAVEDDGSYTFMGSWDETELANPLFPKVTIQGMDPRDFYYFVATAYSDTQESDYSEDTCGKLIPGYDHYVDCDFQENTPKSNKKSGGSGASGCFISTIF